MRVAVLGMGRMGHALAERLLDGGHELTVWNRTPHKADDLIARGAGEAETPARAVEGVHAVFTSLADDDAVRAAVTGPNGVAAGLTGDSVLDDASTVSPDTTGELDRAVGGRFLASPVLGSPDAVRSGEATYLIGGPRECYDRLRPAFEAIADERHRRYVGEDPKLATTLKVISNYLLLSGIAALSEAVAAAQAAGVPDDLVRDYFGNLPLVAPGLRNRLDKIISGVRDGWFSMRLGAKDARLAGQLAEAHGLSLPLVQAVRQRYEEAVADGLADADIAAVAELVRGHAGARS